MLHMCTVQAMSKTLNYFFGATKTATLFLFFFAYINFISPPAKAQEIPITKSVDVVIAMDLSGSTNGLLENFRAKFWDIINQWKLFKPSPNLRIGIVGFSRLSFPSQNGYVKIICDLTDDYDVVSRELYSIKPYVENGYQFVGAAMAVCIENMNWTKEDSALKMIYMMGNGMASYGTTNYRAMCEEAVKRNINVNSIYCVKKDNQQRNRELPAWNEIAELTFGECHVINVIKRQPLFTMRKDLVTLAALNDSMNKTYIGYGRNGTDRYKLMLETDDNASRIFESYFYSRLKYKLSDHYMQRQMTWDIVTYKHFYPESRLAAFKASRGQQNSDVNLDVLVAEQIDKRNKLINSMKAIFPEQAEEKVHDEIIKEDFEIANMLDRALISSFYHLAIANGFEH